MRCVEEFDQYIPPLWVMCLESVAHLLVLFNFSIIVIIINITVIIIIIMYYYYYYRYDYIIIIGHAELLNQLPHLLLSLSALQKGTYQGGVTSATSANRVVPKYLDFQLGCNVVMT